MIQKVLALSALCCLQSTGVIASVEHLAVAPAPVVTAASSQYFERTFNRLVAAQPVLQPVIPVAPVAPAAAPPVFVEPVTRTLPVPIAPTQHVPIEPSVAIAVATAHAAAPIATILLPPYPFGLPPSFGFPPIVVPDQEPKKEPTTPSPTVSVQTSVKEPEATTPFPSPSNTDNTFAQPLPSNQNTNFKQYYAPPQPLPTGKPQKLRTTVEVVPVPLAYIAPPPLHHHHHHHHGHGRPVKYVHSFVPTKLIVRPVRVQTVRVPARLVVHQTPVLVRKYPRNQKSVLRSRVGVARDTEPTTFRPLNRPATKPPKI